MTGVLVALLAFLWALVLIPPLLRARDNTSLGTVNTFNRGMRALGSNRDSTFTGGRYVLTPMTPLDAPDPRLVTYRRRRVFSAMISGLGCTLVLGAVPGLRMIWWASLVLAIAVGGFAAFLVSEKSRSDRMKLEGTNRTTYQRQGAYQRQAVYEQFPDVPTSLRVYQNAREPAAARTRPQPVFRILDDDEDDDGLSELSWARAGQL